MSAAEPAYPHIPYGVADFGRIRADDALYVDKTRFIRALEEHSYVFLIRPRRFGKSLWISILEYYYDRALADRFETLFAGTEIGANPTPNRSRYVVIRYDFSVFRKDPEQLEENFSRHCELWLRGAVEGNADLFPEAARKRILGAPTLNAKLEELFFVAREEGIPLYVLIDEYDNFANDILAHHGEEAYHRFTHGDGFFRSFFAALKGGAGRGGGIERLFITGVSPITLDDVTSGFNIGTNISLSPRFNEVLGFTEAAVADVLRTYRDAGVLRQDVDEALEVMRAWYDGYRFAEDAQVTLFNTDMVLYYLRESILNRKVPRRLIDRNVRIDYGKLRHLLVVNRQLNGNFDILSQIAAEAEIVFDLQDGFPLEDLAAPENFASLLHFFGLLSIRGTRRGRTVLGVPNQTVRQLLHGYLRDGYRDVGVFSVDGQRLDDLVSDMAWRGEWTPVVDFLRDAVAQQTGIRDYMAGEKVIQGFLAAYLGSSRFFQFHSEHELGKGYADLFLEPFLARHPDLPFGYVIELKYLRRGEASGDALASSAARQLDEAKQQLAGYLADPRLGARYPSVRFVGVALVFHGWELVAKEAIQQAAPEPSNALFHP